MIKHGIRATEAKRIIAELAIGQGAALKALNLSPATVNKKAKQSQTLSPGESERVIGFAKLVGQLEAVVRIPALRRVSTPQPGCPAGSMIPSPLLAARGRSISWTPWRAKPWFPRRSRSFRAGPTLESDGLADRDRHTSLRSRRPVRGRRQSDRRPLEHGGHGPCLYVADAGAGVSRDCRPPERGGLPLNRYLVEVTIPDALWASAQMESATSLPIGWDAEPAGRTSIEFGTNWIRSGTAALLVVPSVIVPEELNVLINPQHSDSARITAAKVRKWLYDPRLTKAP